MTNDIWFWLFIACYACGALMLVCWITNGGEQYTRAPRWRLMLVAAFWPFPMVAGLGERFLSFFLEPKH